MPDTDPTAELHRVWTHLAERNFAVTNDVDLGLDPEVRRHIARNYFNEKVLESDHPAVHRDRDRARDVIRYAWRTDQLSLQEHDVVEIRDRSGFAGVRTPSRAILLDDVVMTEWIHTALSLIPPKLRQDEGTFGVNFLRTRTTVVSGPHQDEEEFVMVYVADKQGAGAETTLHRPDDRSEIVYRVTLAPGDLIVFRDKAFLHNASPLTSPPGSQAQRDALVCTVNYPGTYELRPLANQPQRPQLSL